MDFDSRRCRSGSDDLPATGLATALYGMGRAEIHQEVTVLGCLIGTNHLGMGLDVHIQERDLHEALQVASLGKSTEG
jgi:hypothetical protein